MNPSTTFLASLSLLVTATTAYPMAFPSAHPRE